MFINRWMNKQINIMVYLDSSILVSNQKEDTSVMWNNMMSCTSYKWNNTICILAYFDQYNDFYIYARIARVGLQQFTTTDCVYLVPTLHSVVSHW